MKFTELSGHPVRAGVATVLRPSVRSGRSAACPDPRPAAHVQEAHLREARARAAAGVPSPSWLGTAFELPGVPDLAVLDRAVLAWLDRHESLRSALTCADGEISRTTFAPGAIGLNHEPLGRFGSAAALTARLDELFDAGTDPLSWPAFLFAVVAHGDSFTVCAAFDHSIVDGYSIVMVAGEIAELYEAGLAGREHKMSTVGSYVDFAAAERGAAAEVSADDEVVGRWREFLARHGGQLPGFPASPGPGAQSGGSTLVLGAAETAEFGVACRKLGGMPMTGALAALGEAIRDETGHGQFAALMSMHTRDAARWSRSMGWYVGLAPMEFATPPGATLAELMAGAAGGMGRAKQTAAVPLDRVAQLLGRPLRPRFVLSYMDLRRVPGADRWQEMNVATLRPRCGSGDEVHLWITHAREGLRVAARYPADSAVPVCLDRLRERLRRLVSPARPVPQLA